MCSIHDDDDPLSLPPSFPPRTHGAYLQVLKGTSVSLWVRNMQLSGFGMLLGVGCVWVKDGEAVRENGFFYG